MVILIGENLNTWVIITIITTVLLKFHTLGRLGANDSYETATAPRLPRLSLIVRVSHQLPGSFGDHVRSTAASDLAPMTSVVALRLRCRSDGGTLTNSA